MTAPTIPVPAFAHRLRIYYEDTDAGGVVYHASYLRFAERARTEWLRSLGFDQVTLRAKTGIVIVVRSARIEYRKPAVLDDALTVECRLVELGSTRMSLAQRVLRGETLLAELEIGLVCVTAATMRPAAWPQMLAEAFAPRVESGE